MLFASLVHKSRTRRANNFRTTKQSHAITKQQYKQRYIQLLGVYEEKQNESISLHAQICHYQDEITRIQHYLFNLMKYYEYQSSGLPTLPRTINNTCVTQSPRLSHQADTIPPNTTLFQLIQDATNKPQQQLQILAQCVQKYKQSSESFSSQRVNFEETIASLELQLLQLSIEKGSLQTELLTVQRKFDKADKKYLLNVEAMHHDILQLNSKIEQLSTNLIHQTNQLTQDYEHKLTVQQHQYKNEMEIALSQLTLAKDTEHITSLNNKDEESNNRLAKLAQLKDVEIKLKDDQLAQLRETLTSSAVLINTHQLTIDRLSQQLTHANEKLEKILTEVQHSTEINDEMICKLNNTHEFTIQQLTQSNAIEMAAFKSQCETDLAMNQSSQTELLKAQYQSEFQIKLDQFKSQHLQGYSEAEMALKYESRFDSTIKALQDKLIFLAHSFGQKEAGYRNELDQLQNELKTTRETHAIALSTVQDNHEKIITSYKTNQDKLLSQITTLVMNKTHLQEEYEDISVTIAAVKNQYSQLLLKEGDMGDEIQRLLEIVESKDVEFNALSKQYHTINEKVIEFEAWYNSKNDLTLLTRELESELANSNVELTAIKMERDELQATISVYQEKVNQLSAALKTQNERVRALQFQLPTNFSSDASGLQTPMTSTPNKSITNHITNTTTTSLLPSIKPSPQLLLTPQKNLSTTQKLNDLSIKKSTDGSINNNISLTKGYVLRPLVSTFNKGSNQVPTPQISNIQSTPNVEQNDDKENIHRQKKS